MEKWSFANKMFFTSLKKICYTFSPPTSFLTGDLITVKNCSLDQEYNFIFKSTVDILYNENK